MGAYLSKPITMKETEEGEGNRIAYGASSMQGWRVSQEDAHNCITELDESSSFFAVYDGHGGAEVAIYLSRHFPEFFKKTEAYKAGNWKDALHEAYVKIDEQIKAPETIQEIQRIAKSDDGQNEKNIADYEEENVGALYEEATMPIEALMAKYSGVAAAVAARATASFFDRKDTKGTDTEKPGSSKSASVSQTVSATATPAESSSSSLSGCGAAGSSSSSAEQPGSSSIDADVEEPMSSTSTSTSASAVHPKPDIDNDNEPECSSSSSKTTAETVSNQIDIDNTAEADNAANEASPSEPVPRENDSSSNGDVEPSSSTNEVETDAEAVVADNSESRKTEGNSAVAASSSNVTVNGIEESVEPDSTEEPESTVKVSPSSASLNGTGTSVSRVADAMTSKTNGETEVVADSTQSENSMNSSNESPKKKGKGKTHPSPPVIVSPPQPKRSSARRKAVNDAKVYKEFINEESASSESDDDPAVKPFMNMNDSDSDDDDDDAMGDIAGVVGNSSSSDNDDEDEDMEEDDDEDDEDDEDDDEEADDQQLLSDMQEPGYDSGCTAVAAFLKWEGDKLGLWVANAGDSRCVVSRGGKALEMSHDHKPEDEIEARRIINAGGKVTQDGRVNGGLNLSRAIGDHSYKQNKTLPPEEQMITPVPDIRHEILDPSTDEFLILACDGVWNSMSSQEVIDFIALLLNKNVKVSTICEELFDACLAQDTTGDGTGCDNMTAIIVKLPKLQVSDAQSTEESASIPIAAESSEHSKRRLSTSEAEAEESKRLKIESN